MKGLKLAFDGKGGLVLTDQVVEDEACLRQNAAVNLAQIRGSDRCFPDKGTRLLLAGVQGIIFDTQSAQHEANFAALDTLTFMQVHEYTEEVAKLPTTVTVQLTGIALGKLTYRMSFTFPEAAVADTLIL